MKGYQREKMEVWAYLRRSSHICCILKMGSVGKIYMYKWHMEREGKEMMKRVFPHCLIRLKFGWFTSLVSAENDTMCCIEDTVLDLCLNLSNPDQLICSTNNNKVIGLIY